MQRKNHSKKDYNKFKKSKKKTRQILNKLGDCLKK